MPLAAGVGSDADRALRGETLLFECGLSVGEFRFGDVEQDATLFVRVSRLRPHCDEMRFDRFISRGDDGDVGQEQAVLRGRCIGDGEVGFAEAGIDVPAEVVAGKNSGDLKSC